MSKNDDYSDVKEKVIVTTVGQTLSQNIERLLKERNMTQLDLAKKSGIAPATISNYMIMRNYPRPDKMIKIAHALGVTISELTAEHDAKNADSSFVGNVAQSATNQHAVLPHNASYDDNEDSFLGKSKEFWQIVKMIDKMDEKQQKKVIDMIKVINQ